MAKYRFSLAEMDPGVLALLEITPARVMAQWARDCVLRVLPFYQAAFPDDQRPGQALATLQAWIETGEFSMKVIRKASLDAHAAARGVGEDTPARSAARAAGQAVATAHVTRHALAAANYALQAVYRSESDQAAEAAVAQERAWQLKHLEQLSVKQLGSSSR